MPTIAEIPDSSQGKIIFVKVTPYSSRNEVEQIGENFYHIRLTASPVDGKANQKLTEVLAEYFRHPKSMIIITKGRTAKNKTVKFLV